MSNQHCRQEQPYIHTSGAAITAVELLVVKPPTTNATSSRTILMNCLCAGEKNSKTSWQMINSGNPINVHREQRQVSKNDQLSPMRNHHDRHLSLRFHLILGIRNHERCNFRKKKLDRSYCFFICTARGSILSITGVGKAIGCCQRKAGNSGDLQQPPGRLQLRKSTH